MRKQAIKFKKDTVIEVSFASVKEDMQAQLFNEYFPKVMPIVGELGGQSLGSFKVTDSKTSLDDPQMCALFQWATLDDFKKLHADPRFLEIKHIRDDALSFFINGLFFTVEKDVEVEFNEDESYLLSALLEKTTSLNKEPLVNLSKAVVNSDKPFQPTNVRIDSLDDETAEQFNNPGSNANLFKLIMNFPA